MVMFNDKYIQSLTAKEKKYSVTEDKGERKGEGSLFKFPQKEINIFLSHIIGNKKESY